MNLSIYGHASVNVMIYTVNGVYREVYVPGGAMFIQLVLRSFQAQQNTTLGPDDIIPNVAETTYKNTDKYRREYMELYRYEDEKKRSYYAISRHLGYREGKSNNNIYYSAPNHADSPFDLIIYDKGFGGLSLPEGCRTALWASNKVLPDREQFESISNRCVLFIDADVLRSAGAMVSRQISWERTVSELIWQLQNNPAISYLLEAPHILIPFAEDGMVYINNTDGQMGASLVLTHGGAEGTLRERINGHFDDTFAMMTAVVGLMFPDFILEKEKTLALRLILEISEGFMLSGYGADDKSDDINISIPSTSRNWTAFDIPLTCDEARKKVCVRDDWTIANSVGDKRLYDVAFEYVMKGAEVIAGLPQLSFGALTTVDRWEIEAYQNIRNLIIGYANVDSVRPLSIAVFGSPGSGKSFGVTQIAQNVLPGKVKKLEFNVSQFTSLTELGTAFQKVRDTILNGKLPLVFLDEFDTDRDGLSLGWVKSFLMPMQDGKFRDESGEHPLGKCILVFAGGTAGSFEEFVKPMSMYEADGQETDKRAYEIFKNIKGPDFVSRLRGIINVLGPNPKNGDDKNYIMRRALLLRSLCERKLKFSENPAPISKDIIRAMLLVPEYKHGARSMEAILEMSRIDGNTWEPVSLPSYAQLSLHVDADAFVELVLQNQI